MGLQLLLNHAVNKLAPNMGSWPIYAYGNSYAALTGSHYTSGRHYLQLAAARLGAGTVTSYGTGGSRAIDTWAHAGSAGTWPGSGKGPATNAQWPGASSRSGLVVLDLAVNDIGHYASGTTPAAITTANTQYLDSMKATRRAILALLASESRVEATAYSATSGTWSTLAGAPYSGDSVEYTTTAVGTESSVTFAEDLEKVEVYSDGTAPVWWTCSGETPSTSTGVGYLIPGAAIDVRSPKSGSATVVKLISTGTPNVRVQRGD